MWVRDYLKSWVKFFGLSFHDIVQLSDHVGGGGGNMSCEVLELYLVDACLSIFNLIDCELIGWSIVIE